MFLGAFFIFIIFVLFFGSTGEILFSENTLKMEMVNEKTKLPQAHKQETELGELIYERRSVRNFKDEKVSLEKVSDILWAAEGITVDGVTGPTRTSPSAGATDPLEIYLAVNQVENLEQGIYRYQPENEELEMVVKGDKSPELAQSALGQAAIAEAPFTLIITANFARTTGRYGDRGRRYVKIESGHAAQNANLMAENLELSGVIIGAFRDEEVQRVLGGIDEEPLIILPLGY